MQHLGLSAIVLFWVSLGYIFARWGVRLPRTISDHVASMPARKTYLISTLISITALSFFLLFWLLPEYNAPRAVYLLVLIAYFAELPTSLVPRRDNKAIAHDVASNLAGGSLILAMASFANNFNTSSFVNAVVWTALVYMVITSVVLVRLKFKYYLVVQSLYFAIFHFAILSLTYF